MLIAIICSILVLIGYLTMERRSRKEIEYERKLEENLADEFIIDPKTGTKLTLEQAESGLWITPENVHIPMSENEIARLFTEEEKNIERSANILKIDKSLLSHDFSQEEIDTLQNSLIMSKYNDWTYKYCYYNSDLDFYVFMPTIEIEQSVLAHFPDSHIETQIMFWINTAYENGHYYLYQKSVVDVLFDQFNECTQTLLTDYVTLVNADSNNLVKLVQQLKVFENLAGLEIEIIESRILVKSTKWVTPEETTKMLNAVKTCANTA